MLPRRNTFRPFDTNTPGPSPTFTLTPTFVNATGRAPATRVGPTPLAVLFHVSYTATPLRSEEHTSELSHHSISYAVFCLKKKKKEEKKGTTNRAPLPITGRETESE